MDNLYKIKLDDCVINCEVSINDKKTPSLIVDIEKGVIITVPSKISEEQIKCILHKNKDSILSYYEELKLLMNKFPPFQAKDGENITFFGEGYEISIKEVSSKTGKVTMVDGKIVLELPKAIIEQGNIQDKSYEYFKKWYKEEGAKIAEEIKNAIAEELDLNKDEITITLKNIKDAWSNCSVGKNNIGLHWKIAILSKEDIKFLLCFEMAKLKEEFDTESYWTLLNRLYPNFRDRMEKLNEMNPVHYFYLSKLNIKKD